MASAFILRDLELRVGVRTVATFCDDNGDGSADDDIVEAILDEAQAIAQGILLKGFPAQEQLDNLMTNDIACRGATVDIAIGLMGRRRPELLSNDDRTGSLYANWRKEGERVLERIAMADRRVTTEKAPAGTGNNAHVAQGASPQPANLVFVTGRNNGYRARGTF